jgi:hypothetical protein
MAKIMRTVCISLFERWALSVGRFPRVAILILISVLCPLISVSAGDNYPLGGNPTMASKQLTGGEHVQKVTEVDQNGTALATPGDASATNQTAIQANAGNNASKANAVQGITGGKPIPASIDQSTPGTTNGVTVNANPSSTAATLTQGTKAVTAAGTPERLIGSTTKVESVEIFARKAPGTANTGAIYIGISASGGANYRVLAPDESFSISAPAGKKIDLNTIYIDAANSADAVAYTAVN